MAVRMRNRLFCGLIGLICAAPSRAGEQGRSYTDARTGVVINYEANKAMFPAEWLAPPISAKASSLNAADANQAQRAALIGLAKYPTGFLRRNLKNIYLVYKLAYYGTDVGGFGNSDDKALYLSYDSYAGYYSPTFMQVFLEDSLHHEFTHVLMENHADKFSKSRWTKLNSAGFQYRSKDMSQTLSGIQKSDYENSIEGSDQSAYWKRGFANRYGMDSFDEDVATMSAIMLTGDKKFWQAVDQNAVLHRKVDSIVAFYHALDGAFTLAYFRSLTFSPPSPVPASPVPLTKTIYRGSNGQNR